MTHCIRHRFAAFGIALLLLLLSGCQGGGGGAVVTPDKINPAPGTDWRTLLFDEMNAQSKGTVVYQRDDDAAAGQMLDCVRSISENAAAAEEKLKDNGQDGYAIGARDIRNKLKEQDADNSISNQSVTCLVGYAVVPQEQAGDVALWDAAAIEQFAAAPIRSRCYVSLNKDTPQASHVGFAKGEIGNKTFVIAVFR